MIIYHFNVTFLIDILKFQIFYLYFLYSIKSTKKVQMPHKHSVMYIINKECELKKHKQFYLLYISEVTQSKNRRVSFFIAV